jgi:hypothetical protein
VAVPPEHWFTRASDAPPSWLGLPTLAGCGSLPRSVGLRCSPPQPPRQTGGSDLCSRHQHASSGHSACFVIRVTQLCQISQVYHQLARDAGLVALAAAHASSDLQLTNTTWMTWVLSHAAWACVCQIASQQLKRPSPTPASNPSRLELSVCNCVLSGVMLSAQAGRGAVDRYVRRGNDGRCVHALGVSMSLQIEHRASRILSPCGREKMPPEDQHGGYSHPCCSPDPLTPSGTSLTDYMTIFVGVLARQQVLVSITLPLAPRSRKRRIDPRSELCGDFYGATWGSVAPNTVF